MTRLFRRSRTGAALRLREAARRMERFITQGDPADLDEAIERFRSVIATNGDIPVVRAAALANLGDALRMHFYQTGDQNDLQQSVAALEEAVTATPARTFEAGIVRVNLAASLTGRYSQFHDRRDLERALEVSKEAIRWTAGNQPARGLALTWRATVLFYLFEESHERQTLDEGITAASQAVAALAGPTPARAQALVRLAEGLLKRFEWDGQVSDASVVDEVCDEAISITGEGMPLHHAALRLRSRALRLLALNGDLVAIEDAIALAEQALRLAHNWDRAEAQVTLAMALRCRYPMTGSAADLRRIIELFEEARLTADSAIQPMIMGCLCDAYLFRYYQTKNLDDIEHSVEAGEAAIASASVAPSEQAGLLLLLGSALGERREARAAEPVEPVSLDREIELLEEALRLAGTDSPFRCAQLRGLGLALADRAELHGNPSELEMGLAFLNEAIAQSDNGFERVQLLDLVAQKLWQRYEREGDIGDAECAVTNWEDAARLSVEVSAGAPVTYRLFQQTQWASVYKRLVEGLVVLAQADPDDENALLRRAMVIAEGAKSRLLSEILGQGSLPAPPGIERHLVKRERELVAQLSALDKIEFATIGLAQIGSAPTPAARARRRDELVKELRVVWADIAQSGNEGDDYVALRRGQLPEWDQLAALAREFGDETVLLSFFLTEKRTYLFILRAGWAVPQVVTAELGSSEWERLLGRFVREVHGYDGTGRRGETWHRALQEFCERVGPYLGAARRAVIAAEGPGHLIPWVVISRKAGWADAVGAPLPLVTTPALLALDRIRRRGPSTGTGALIVGNPTGDLRFAEDEARAVAANENVKALIGAKASKQIIQPRLGGARIVHLATHAFFESGLPLDSGVILVDGVLSAREMITAEMHADLVVLSGCQTGMSDRLGGDEVAGLAQAFLFAGARSVLVTLWSVDDPASAETMRSFYRRLNEGEDKAAALACAISDVRSMPEWSHPYYWGAFCLTGLWD